MRHSTHRVRFFFNDTATTEIYTLSLHDALPIFLLVDDRPENLLALEAVLAPLPCKLVSVTSGQEALRRLLHDEFALILLDVQMPELDGFETAEYIKRRKRTRAVPIIFVTAISKERHHVFRGYETGAVRSEEHTSELQSRQYLVCRLLLDKKKHHSRQAH